GHAPIPANVVVTASNVQALTGLTPQQFADRASVAVGRSAGFFFFGPFGALAANPFPVQGVPITIDPNFKTPHTLSYNIGIQRQITKDMSVEANFYHRDIENVLGVRETNLAFISRIPGHSRTYLPPGSTLAVDGFGPWYSGTFNGFSISFNKRFSRRFTLGAY